MMFMVSVFVLISMLPLFIYLMNVFMSINEKKNREKTSPFECGFDPMTSSRLPFSIQFYMITLMFLIFDIEIVLMIPMLMIIDSSLSLIVSFSFLLFLLVLIFTLWLEWSFNCLKWVN